MKTLYLFRHGDSEESGFEVDYCRKLTEEGRKRSGSMAEHLKKEGHFPDVIISSGTVRAKETASIIARAYCYSESDIVVEDILYETRRAEDIMALVRNSSPKISSLMIVGHNPVLSEFIKYVTGSLPEIDMKKSSVVRIDFMSKEWGEILSGSGEIVFYKKFVDGGIVNAAGDFS